MKFYNTLSVKEVFAIKGEALYNVFAVLPIRDWRETTTRQIGRLRLHNEDFIVEYANKVGSTIRKKVASYDDAIAFFERCDPERYANNWVFGFTKYAK